VVRLAHAGSREAVIQLPETLRPAIGSNAQAELFGKQDASVPATLRQLSDTADARTRTFEARYVLQGALAGAPLGATVTIRIADVAPQAGLQVPIGALLDAGKGPGVWVVAGDPARVAWRPVRLEHLDDDNARVSGALKQGERVVALGAHLLREGETVRVSPQAVALASEGARP
jgi:multidrug efflux pump subunit AcrA (membrane-fusion protein)